MHADSERPLTMPHHGKMDPVRAPRGSDEHLAPALRAAAAAKARAARIRAACHGHSAPEQQEPDDEPAVAVDAPCAATAPHHDASRSSGATANRVADAVIALPSPTATVPPPPAVPEAAAGAHTPSEPVRLAPSAEPGVVSATLVEQEAPAGRAAPADGVPRSGEVTGRSALGLAVPPKPRFERFRQAMAESAARRDARPASLFRTRPAERGTDDRAAKGPAPAR